MLFSLVAGYFLGRRRRRQASPVAVSMVSDLAQPQLAFLTEIIGSVRVVVNELLGIDSLGPPTKASRQGKTVVDNPGKPGRIKRFSLGIKRFLLRSPAVEIRPPDNQCDPLAGRLKELKEAMRGIKSDLIVMKLRLESRKRPAAKATVDDTREDFGYPESGATATPIQEFGDEFESPNDSGVGGYRNVESKSEQPIIVRRSLANTGLNIIDLYNQAVRDTVARERFRESHQPLRVGTVNAVERRQNPTATIKPEFKETTEGDFFAFRMSGSNQYAVVPRLGLTIGPVSYNAGALGEMFGNPTYDPTRSYSRYQVRKPAIFRRDGDRWELQSPGQLDLGPGD
jgi:hypothetical protein